MAGTARDRVRELGWLAVGAALGLPALPVLIVLAAAVPIATDLVITEKSVSNNINTLFAKLGLPPTAHHHRRVVAVLAYLDQTSG